MISPEKLDRIAAQAVIDLWDDPVHRSQMRETGMTQQQINDIAKKFKLCKK